MDPCVRLLRELVAIDSVNPSLAPGAAGEGQIAGAIAEHLRRLGLDVHIQEVVPGRPNVIGVFEGDRPGRALMFCGHVDTVGVDGMAAPFDPVERNGRLYGRGAQDMKGGVAAMIDAVRVLTERPRRPGRVIVAAVIDEEYASIGADSLVKEWTADAAVVTEPTDLQIGVGHKGFAWFEIETHGRAAHGSRPTDGLDAIVHMGRVLGRLEQLDRALQSRTPHPVMATASLHASIIQGGREWSSYPAHCRLQMERRTIAGETEESAAAEIQFVLDALQAADVEFRATSRLVFSRPPYEIASGHELTSTLSKAAAAVGCRAEPVGMSFWTDAAVLGGAGIPSVLFGPGGAGLHSSEEFVIVNEVLSCRDALVRLAEAWL